MVTSTSHVIARAGFTLRGALGTLEISNIFLSNIGKDQKKSHHASAGPLAVTVPYYGKSYPGYCITFIKRLDVGLR